jgi:uncharacterized protein (DUF1778 family)
MKSYKKISLEWPAGDLEMVTRAAKLVGMSRAAFIRGAASRRAERALDNQALHDRPEVDVPVFARKQAE